MLKILVLETIPQAGKEIMNLLPKDLRYLPYLTYYYTWHSENAFTNFTCMELVANIVS